MLAQQTAPTPQVGEEQSSGPAAAPVLHWSTEPPEPDAGSLAELATEYNWLRPGGVVYISETRRHTLTEDDLNAAARAVIGGAQ